MKPPFLHTDTRKERGIEFSRNEAIGGNMKKFLSFLILSSFFYLIMICFDFYNEIKIYNNTLENIEIYSEEFAKNFFKRPNHDIDDSIDKYLSNNNINKNNIIIPKRGTEEYIDFISNVLMYELKNDNEILRMTITAKVKERTIEKYKTNILFSTIAIIILIIIYYMKFIRRKKQSS